jgi:transcriptional regulator with XRE-family HTH domain
MSQIGPRLKKARHEAGLTQEALAHAAGLSLPTVQRSEAGRHEPSLATVRALSGALDIDVSTLVDETEPAEAAS